MDGTACEFPFKMKNHVQSTVTRSSLIGIALLSILILGGSLARATDVSGTLSTNTTWTASGSPYNVTGTVRVAAGATLTIEPGVRVVVAHYNGIIVEGSLVAIGTSSDRIEFDGSTASPGWWAGVHIRDAGSATLDYVDILNTGYSYYAGVYKVGTGNLSLRHSTISRSSAAGLRLSSGSGSFTSENNSFHDNVDGVRLSPNTSFKDTTSTFSGNSFAPVAADGGTHNSNVTWELSSAYAIVISGTHVIAAGTTLTLKPGLVVKSKQYYGIYVDGQLLAQGTAQKPIHFTSHRDDAVGGDSNNDGTDTSPSKGWWAGIMVRNDGSATFDYATIAYGGYSNYACVFKVGTGDLSLRNSTLRQSNYAGLRLTSGYGSFTSENNSFNNNADGVRLGLNT